MFKKFEKKEWITLVLIAIAAVIVVLGIIFINPVSPEPILNETNETIIVNDSVETATTNDLTTPEVNETNEAESSSGGSSGSGSSGSSDSSDNAECQLDGDCDDDKWYTDDFCIDEECVNNLQECEYIDTDNGNNVQDYGVCDDFKNAVPSKDSCDGDILTEYFLKDGEDCFEGCKEILFNCKGLGSEYTCVNGACLDVWNDALGCIDTLSNGICDEDEECTSFCDTFHGDPYDVGLCENYNPYGAISQEMACINNGGNFYSNSEGTCAENNVCCCYDLGEPA